MKAMRMSVIYQPDGKTLEYAELGLNPYTGCSHNCSYCYNKREDRPQGPYDQPAKKANIKNIQHDLLLLERDHDRRAVHISFMGDPYDTHRANNIYIRSVLMAFRAYDHPFQILTKGGMLAARDFDLYGPNDSFGVTLTFDNDVDSRRYEPGAALPARSYRILKGGSQPQYSYMGFMRAGLISRTDTKTYRNDPRVRGFVLGREAESLS